MQYISDDFKSRNVPSTGAYMPQDPKQKLSENTLSAG